jgi:hypothetical protein
MSSSYIKTTRSNIEFNLSDNDPKSNTVAIQQLEDISENAGDGLIITVGSDTSGERIIIPSTDNNIIIGRSEEGSLTNELSNYSNQVILYQSDDLSNSRITVASDEVKLLSTDTITISNTNDGNHLIRTDENGIFLESDELITLSGTSVFTSNAIFSNSITGYGDLSYSGDASFNIVEFDGTATFNDVATFSNEAIFQGTTSINDTLTVDALSTFSNTATFQSNISVNGDVTFSNSILTLVGTSRIASTAATSITSTNTLTLNGGNPTGCNRIRLSNGGVDISGIVISSNYSTFQDRVDVSNLYCHNDASFNEDLYILSNLTVSGNIITSNSSGTTDICGSFTVWSNADFKDTVEFSNNVSYESNIELNATTAEISGTTLNILGSTGVNIKANNQLTTITSDSTGVTISGDLILEDDLNVTGQVVFSNGLTVDSSDVLFSNDLTVQGDLTVNGTTTTTTTVLNDLDIDDNKIRLNYNEVSATVRDAGIIFNNVSSTNDVSTSSFFYETDGGSNTFILGFIDLDTGVTDNFPLITPSSGDDMDRYCDLIMRNLNAKEINLVSDRRLKYNIEPINNSEEIVERLKPITFNWKRNSNNNQNDEPKEYGFIAQEVENIIPTIVKERNDGFKGVAYQKMVPILVDVLQKQKIRIDELEEKMNKQQEDIIFMKQIIARMVDISGMNV